MRPVLTDRTAIVIILASLVAWAAALSVLWGWSVDPAGTMSLMALAWVFLSAAWLLRRRGRWALRGVWLLGRLGASESVPLAAALRGDIGSSKEDVRRRLRLLSVGAVTAMACMLLATGLVIFTRFGSLLLGEWFLFSDTTWRLLEMLMLLLGSLPVAAAFVLVLYGSAVVRAGGGRDTYASAYRDWLLASACGLGAFAVAWWFGTNLVYFIFALAGAVLVASLTSVSRGDLSTHPRKKMLPFGPPARWAGWSIALSHAMLVLVLAGQARLLGDVLGLSFTRRLLWWGLSLVLLAYFLGRIDRKGRTPGRLQVCGCLIGVGAAVWAQATELALCLTLDGASSALVAGLAVATQVPLAALAATLISGQRRDFATAGGSVGRYLAACAAGLAGACLFLWLVGAWGLTAWALLSVMGAMMIFGAALGAWHARRRRDRAGWLAWTFVLLLAFGAGIYSAVAAASEVLGTAQAGVWLTSTTRRNRPLREQLQQGVLPPEEVSRNERITRCIAEAFRRRKGRWWHVCSDARDLPARAEGGTFDPVYARLFIVGSNPEAPRAPSRWDRWPIVTPSAESFLRYARLNYVAATGYDFYEGIFLAPLPADHPQAWRCYNELTLRRCRRMTELVGYERQGEAGPLRPVLHHGLMLLRTQASADRVRQALRIARTFDEAVSTPRRLGQREHHVSSPGWAIVSLRQGGLDMLLIGPADACGSPEVSGSLMAELAKIVADDYDTFLVPIRRLWPDWKNISPIYIFNPPGERLADTPSLEGLREHLQLVQPFTARPARR
jgi:hypothetical protein